MISYTSSSQIDEKPFEFLKYHEFVRKQNASVHVPISFDNYPFAAIISTYQLRGRNLSKYETCLTTNLDDLHEQLTDYLADIGYQYSYLSTTYAVAIKIDKEGYLDTIIELSVSKNKILLVASGERTSIKAELNAIYNKFHRPLIAITEVISISPDGEPRLSYNYLDSTATELNSAHYPFIKGIDTLVEEFLTSQSNVLFLIGPPGTGKTTLIRNCVTKAGRLTFMTSNMEVASSPGFLAIASKEPNSLVVIEDADTLVRSRELGNTSMSGLLNLADGLVTNNIKIIISTNLESTRDVDSAFLRPGRNFRELKFRKLSYEEYLPLNADLKDHSGDLTLAEVLNFKAGQHSNPHRSKTTVGF